MTEEAKKSILEASILGGLGDVDGDGGLAALAAAEDEDDDDDDDNDDDDDGDGEDDDSAEGGEEGKSKGGKPKSIAELRKIVEANERKRKYEEAGFAQKMFMKAEEALKEARRSAAAAVRAERERWEQQ